MCFQPGKYKDAFKGQVKASFSAVFQAFDLFRIPDDINYNDRLIFVVIIH